MLKCDYNHEHNLREIREVDFKEALEQWTDDPEIRQEIIIRRTLFRRGF